MAKLGSLAQSKQKQNDGVWCSFEGIKFKIARIGNDRFKAAVAAEAANNRERKERGEPVRDHDTFWRELIASTVLVDWRDLEDDNGDPMLYSVDKSIQILNDERFSDLFEFVEREAVARRNFKEAADERAEKN